MPPLKIAIFEDEFLLAHDLKRQIQQFNYEVIAIFRKAEDGIKFFEEIQSPENLPDVVLLDISLAGKMNGIEAARIMVEKYDFAIVFLSGMSQMEFFDEACKTKPYVFLFKPFEIQQALVSIKLAVYQRTLETDLRKHKEDVEKIIGERIKDIQLAKEEAQEVINRQNALLFNLGDQIREPMMGIRKNFPKLKEQITDKPHLQQFTTKIDYYIQNILTLVEKIRGFKE